MQDIIQQIQDLEDLRAVETVSAKKGQLTKKINALKGKLESEQLVPDEDDTFQDLITQEKFTTLSRTEEQKYIAKYGKNFAK